MHLYSIRPHLTRLLRSTFLLLALGFATPSFAGVHFTLSGQHSKSNTGYQSVEAGALSGGIAFDIGQYIRLGYTHMQQLQASEGYACEENSSTSTPDGNGGYLVCPTFQSLSHIVGHSVELTLIVVASIVIVCKLSFFQNLSSALRAWLDSEQYLQFAVMRRVVIFRVVFCKPSKE